MKFFYAIMVFFLSTYIFLWALVFIVPTPKIYKIGDILKNQDSMKSVDEATLTNAIDTSKKTNNDETFIFESSMESKRSSALFLVSIITFVIIFFQIIIFHKRSHILFPMVAGTVVSYIFYSSIWQFTNSLPKTLYVDFTQTRAENPGFMALIFLSIYLIVFSLILLFGSWSKLSEVK